MVTVVNYASRKGRDGKDFFALTLQGQPEFVRASNTQMLYMTARRTSVLCTFNEETCKSLLGFKYPGTIQRVACDEYDYVIPETKEVIRLNFRYEYSDEAANLEEAVFEAVKN